MTRLTLPFRLFTAWFGRFLLNLAGADLELLGRTRERVKYQRIGGTVLTTGVLAFASSAFAFHAALHLPVPAAVAAGLVWGGIITNLDSWIVTATKRQDIWFFISSISSLIRFTSNRPVL